MENEKICQMALEAVADRATLDVIRKIMMSDMLVNYEKHDAVCAALGINKKDLSGESSEPST